MTDTPRLRAAVESAVPKRVHVGRGAVLFIHGWCYHERETIARLWVGVGGERHPVSAHSMPRADILRASDPGRDPGGNAFRSGFWALVAIPAIEQPAEAELELVVSLGDGGEAAHPVDVIDLDPGHGFAPEDGPADGGDPGQPLVAICMATHNPDPTLLRRQLDSIRAQTHGNWICLISDDHSAPDALATLEAEIEGDDRFRLSRSEHRRGYYLNFERALTYVPAEAAFVALSDQDDSWYPDKLATLVDAARREGVSLAYSDMRLTDESGEVISPTYWTERRTNHTNMATLLVANTITAAASLFPRELLERALPFPQRIGDAFHDHWLALVALASGRISYVDRPLYDYVQHAGNAYGSRGAQWGPRHLPRPVQNRTALSQWLLRLRADYFGVVIPAQGHAELLALRCADTLRGRKARAVALFRRSQSRGGSIVAAGWQSCRALGARVRKAPAMGRERLIARGLLWRSMIRPMTAMRRRKPEYYAQGRPVPAPPPIDRGSTAEPPALVAQLIEKLAPIPLEVDPSREPTVNMLVPTIDLEHFFAAYIGKFNLARRLAEAGIRMRLVAVDPTFLPEDWKRRVSSYEGLGPILDLVEVAFAPTREQLRLRVSPSDRFIATTSWTAHLAHRASAELGRSRFVFVIQEYDPLTYPVGTLGAITRQAYSYPHFAVFSTELLREFFRRRRIGVYAAGLDAGESDSTAFDNAITQVDPPTVEGLEGLDQRLLFYARPEAHAERNMYELGVIALSEAIAEGRFPGRWEFFGIGAREESRLRLTDSATLRILRRADQRAYRRLLGRHSVGLSLQDTPHPSLVPIEMAAAGMRVVTSTFENKTADAMRQISANLIPVEPTSDAIKDGLSAAVRSLGDREGRVGAASVRWPRSWEEAFDDALIERIQRFVEAA